MHRRERMVCNLTRRCSPMQSGRRATCSLIAMLLIQWCVMLVPAALRGDDSAPRNLINATDADNGSAVTLQSGEGLSVSLKITSGTGYSWRIARVARRILRQDGQPTLVSSDHPLPGVAATQVFRFMGAASGTTQLELDYVRPWEKGIAPAKIFRLIVTVS